MSWSEILSWYSDPLFIQFPVTAMLVAIIAFLLFALPWTWLAWRDPKWARPYRIQTRDFQVERFFWPTLGRMAINFSVVAVFMVLSWPLLRHADIHAGAVPPWWVFLWQIALFTLMDDFLYYWMHRSMHRFAFLRRAHMVHHRPQVPFALTGNYQHWLEFLLTVNLMMLGPVLLGVHVYVLYAWVAFRQLQAADGHAGYDFGYWNPLHWLPAYNGPVYHDFHHADGEGNYAGFLGYVDRFFATYAKNYFGYTLRAKRKASAAQGATQ